MAQRDVAPDGSYTFTVPRSSANDRGDTFVAIVPCNVDYIGFGDEELERNKRFAFGLRHSAEFARVF